MMAAVTFFKVQFNLSKNFAVSCHFFATHSLAQVNKPASAVPMLLSAIANPGGNFCVYFGSDSDRSV